MEDVGEQGVVQLVGVVAAQDKEDGGADALGHLALVAEQAGQTVDDPAVRQELTNSKQAENVLKPQSMESDRNSPQ